MFDIYKEYTCVLFVKDDDLIIQTKRENLARGGKGGAVYKIPLSNISSVSTDEIPSKWSPTLDEPSTWDSPKDVLKASVTSRKGPAPIYTSGVYINPQNHNRTFLLYNHNDKCLTLTLKEPTIMIIQRDDFSQTSQKILTGTQKAMELAVKDVSVEVDDKEATAKSLREVLRGNKNALPRPVPDPKEVQKEYQNGLKIAMIFVSVAILMILLVLYLIYFRK